MYVRCNPNKNNIKYLSYVQGYRDENNISRQKTVKKIGDWSDLIKLYDDPIKHFNDLVNDEVNKIDQTVKINLNDKLNITDNIKNLGYCILKKVYNELNLNNFFSTKQSKLNIDYKLKDIFELLIYSRILYPSSKKETFDNKNIFFDKFDFSLKDLYRSLDYFQGFQDELQSWIWNRTKDTYKRDTSSVYYDCTNYYFEISYNDTDLIDEEGNILEKNYRKKGPSKEHRPEPIIQMGLLMDKNGIPLSYNLFPGNESEKTTLRPALNKTKNSFNLGRVITVADRGLNTSDNTIFIAGKNDDDHPNHDGYVFGQSVLGSDKEFKEYVLKQDDYITDKIIDNDNEIFFKHKSRIYAKEVQIIRDGIRKNKTKIYQKQMIYYSEKYALRQKKQRELILEKVKDLIHNPGRYTRATSVGAAGYINNYDYDKKTGEIIGRNLSVNEDKIKQEEQFDGYYSIVTSELEMTDKELRDTYKGLWKIEETFKVSKSNLETRPVYVWTKKHIEAHFLTCFVSLVIMRLLENKLGNKYSTESIIKSLKKYNCSNIEHDIYLFNYRDNIITKFEHEFSIDLNTKYKTLKNIKNILNNK
ncbi:MAG: IS1634 family transposase [Bacilli bacterium]